MIEFHVFPEGKRRIITFSYDDGHDTDIRLLELFNKYKVKATFHLNGINYLKKSEEELKEIAKRYEGHEIACHTLRHGWPAKMPNQSVVIETIEDRKILEKIAGYPVLGMSYPSGSFSEDSINAMKACGIKYSRTVGNTKWFNFPEDYMKWNPTCHHRDALPIANTFMENVNSEWYPELFYIWGHSHDLKTEEEWANMEELLKKVSGNEKIWYATNIEIYNYMSALKELRITADEKTFYNPTAIDLWVIRNKCDIIKIPAGKIVNA